MKTNPSLLQQQKEELLELADTMAEAATEFKGQGYRLFLEARERFKTQVDNLFKELSK